MQKTSLKRQKNAKQPNGKITTLPFIFLLFNMQIVHKVHNEILNKQKLGKNCTQIVKKH